MFSSWKKTIDLAASLLAARKIPTTIVDGSKTLSQREAALNRFRKDPNISVLLMTFGTGAVG